MVSSFFFQQGLEKPQHFSMHCSSLSLCSKPFQKKKENKMKKNEKENNNEKREKRKKLRSLQQIMYDIILQCYRPLYILYFYSSIQNMTISLSLSYISSHLQTLQMLYLPTKKSGRAQVLNNPQKYSPNSAALLKCRRKQCGFHPLTQS